MAWTLVQSNTATAFTTSPATPAYGSATTAGNLLVAAFEQGGGTAAPTLPAGWTAGPSQTGASPSCSVFLFFYFNNPGGITTVSVTWTTGPNLAIQLYEFTCPSVASVAAADATGTVSTASVPASQSVTTSANLTANNELAVALMQFRFSAATVATVGPGTNFTQGGQLNNGTSTASHEEWDYRLDTGSSSGSTVTDTPTCSATGAGRTVGVIATFAQPAAPAKFSSRTRPAQAAAPLPRKGRAAGRRGTFGQTGPPVHIWHGPAQAKMPIPPVRGRILRQAGPYGQTGPPVHVWHGPAQAREPGPYLPGRAAGRRGPYGQPGPPLRPPGGPARTRPQPPPGGRIRALAGVFTAPPPVTLVPAEAISTVTDPRDGRATVTDPDRGKATATDPQEGRRSVAGASEGRATVTDPNSGRSSVS